MTDQTTQAEEKPYKQDSFWLRLAFVLFFLFVYHVVQFFVFGLAVLNSVFYLFSGSVSDPLANFAKSLSTYAKQVILFVSFVEEEKPFPFTHWPSDDA